jgi:hypothetical protein
MLRQTDAKADAFDLGDLPEGMVLEAEFPDAFAPGLSFRPDVSHRAAAVRGPTVGALSPYIPIA